MNRKIVVCVAVLCLLAVCLFGGCRQETITTIPPTVITTTTDQTTTMTTAVVPPFYQFDEETFAIQTPYADLQYPVEWQEVVKIVPQEGDVYTVAFTAVLPSGEFPAFDLIFGESDGYLLGTLTTDAGEVPVCIRNYELDAESVPQDEYVMWCGMCDSVNVTISGLVYNNNMIIS